MRLPGRPVKSRWYRQSWDLLSVPTANCRRRPNAWIHRIDRRRQLLASVSPAVAGRNRNVDSHAHCGYTSPNGVASEEPHPRFNLSYLQLHRPERRRLAVGLRPAPLHGFSMAALQAGPSSRTSAVVHSCEQLLVLHELPQARARTRGAREPSQVDLRDLAAEDETDAEAVVTMLHLKRNCHNSFAGTSLFGCSRLRCTRADHSFRPHAVNSAGDLKPTSKT